MSFRNRLTSLLVCSSLLCGVAFAQEAAKPKDEKKPAAAKPDDKKPAAAGQDKHAGGMDEAAMMEAWMKASTPGENHKLMEGMTGDWTYVNKMWHNPDPSAKPEESTGTATIKSMYGGRYFQGEYAGTFEMPGPDGKPQKMDFRGSSVHGYDNVTGKFVGTWIDNMGTGIMTFEGKYDAAGKSFTYTGTFDCPMQQCKVAVREVVKITDKDHHVMEWYETRPGEKERKTMEITYTRKGAK
ncbi:MAG: DUF1579 domain-containing protein [Phycisphaerales bacterium]|nr:DUF1579 domain-containing protein [Phycisphaerales bacterium]